MVAWSGIAENATRPLADAPGVSACPGNGAPRPERGRADTLSPEFYVRRRGEPGLRASAGDYYPHAKSVLLTFLVALRERFPIAVTACYAA